jgi:hypothetical protein
MTHILEKTMPDAMRTGDPAKYRKAVRSGYLPARLLATEPARRPEMVFPEPHGDILTLDR